MNYTYNTKKKDNTRKTVLELANQLLTDFKAGLEAYEPDLFSFDLMALRLTSYLEQDKEKKNEINKIIEDYGTNIKSAKEILLSDKFLVPTGDLLALEKAFAPIKKFKDALPYVVQAINAIARIIFGIAETILGIAGLSISATVLVVGAVCTLVAGITAMLAGKNVANTMLKIANETLKVAEDGLLAGVRQMETGLKDMGFIPRDSMGFTEFVRDLTSGEDPESPGRNSRRLK